jgi:hypothetical protein
MPDLDAFEKEVKANIKRLTSSKEVAARRQAAVWLGEAGDPSAITALAQAYKNDKDAKVRQAAAYSLGMFRALADVWDTDEQDEAVDLLQKVALEGKMGKRLRIRPRALVKFEIGLLLSAILVAVAAFVLAPAIKGGATGTTGSQSAANPTSAPQNAAPGKAALVAGLRQSLTTLSQDATALQQQYQSAQTGKPFDCKAAFVGAAPFTVSDADAQANPDVANIAKLYNDAQAAYQPVKTRFDEACSGKAMTGAELKQQADALLKAQSMFPDIARALAAAESPSVQPTVAPNQPTPVPPTPAPKVDISAHVQALQKIVDDVTGQRGANSLLKQYWTDVQTTGATQGCNTQLTVPADYKLPDDIAKASQDLKVAADVVNNGLLLVRQGQTLFTQACQSNQLAQSAAGGLQAANNAAQFFNLANTSLSRLRGS